MKFYLRFSFIVTIIIYSGLNVVLKADNEDPLNYISPDSTLYDLMEIDVVGSNVTRIGNQDIISVTKEMRQGKNSALELLSDVQTLHYNPLTKEVSYMGSTNIKILVDSVERNQDYILNMPQEKFDRIEVIRKPSGQYSDFEVLINYRTKRDYRGYDGQINGMATYMPGNRNGVGRPFSMAVANGIFNYTHEKWTVSAMMEYNSEHLSTANKETQIYPENNLILTKLPDSRKHPMLRFSSNAIVVYAAGEYKINGAHRLSAYYAFISAPVKGWGDYNYLSGAIDSDQRELLVDKYTRNFKGNTQHIGSLFYNGTVGDWKLHSYLGYHKIDNDIIEKHDYSDGTLVDYATRYRQNILYALAEVSYSPANHRAWTFGLSDYISMNFNKESAINLPDNPFRNDVINNTSELTASFRPSSIFSISGKAAVLVMNNRWNGISSTNAAPRMGLSVSWNPDRDFAFWLNYQSVPTLNYASDLSAYGSFTNMLLYAQGNPDLKPGINHEVTMNLTFLGMLTLQGIYTHSANKAYKIYDSAFGMRPDGTDGTYVSSIPFNGNGDSFQVGLMFQKSWSRFDINAMAAWRYAHSAYQDFSNHKSRPFGNLLLQYRLMDNSLRFLFHYNLNQAVNVTPQSTYLTTTDTFGLMAMKDFMGGKLNLSLSYTLPLHLTSGDRRYDIKSPVYILYSTENNQYRSDNSLTFSVTYRFSGGSKPASISDQIRDAYSGARVN